MKGEFLKIQGIVVAIKANYLIVEVDEKYIGQIFLNDRKLGQPFHLLCTMRKRLIHHGTNCYVGDYVFVGSVDWKSKRAVITDLLERKNLFTRPPVANITDVFVLLSFKSPEFDFNQASRFLLSAEESSLNIYLIINKADLISSFELHIKIQRLIDWGYQIFVISIKNGQGIDELLEQLSFCKVALLCGPSGVGKSSLLQYLLPNERISIGDVSGKLKRGRHTTRHVQLYSLLDDTLIVDTPGFNRPNLEVDSLNLQYLFPEIRIQLKKSSCKFRDCLHRNEPGCIVEKNWERYSQYAQLLEELITSPQ